jgi:glycosyltransferase involved in cell wall biosynthesis
MAAAIQRLLTDEQLARGLASSAVAEVGARYSPESYSQSLLEVYSELIAKTPSQEVEGRRSSLRVGKINS